MRKSGATGAFIGALAIVVLAIAALEWRARIASPVHAPIQPLQAVTSAPRSQPSATATPAPVVYIVQTPKPVVRPRLTPAPSAPPSMHPTPSSTPSAAPIPSPEPVVSIRPAIVVLPTVPAESPNAPPRILALELSSPVAVGGQMVTGTVETSSNVASVEARIAGFSSTLEKIGEGRFRLAYLVPRLPFFLHRTYTVEVIARNTRGDAVTSTIPITVR